MILLHVKDIKGYWRGDKRKILLMDTFIYYSKNFDFKVVFCVQKNAKIGSVKDTILIFGYEDHTTIKTPQNVFWS